MAEGDIIRSREICLARDDVRALAHLLRKKFPDIRFVKVDAGGRSVPDGVFPGTGRPRWKRVPTEFRIDYFEPDDFVAGDAWLEPPGWKPILEPYWMEYLCDDPQERINQPPRDMASAFFRLTNAPRLRFRFGSMPVPADEGETRRWLISGAMYCSPKKFDDEHIRFFAKALRLLPRVASPMMVQVDERTLERIGEPFKSSIWAGFHMRRIVRADPTLTIEKYLRPTDDDMPYRPMPARRQAKLPAPPAEAAPAARQYMHFEVVDPNPAARVYRAFYSSERPARNAPRPKFGENASLIVPPLSSLPPLPPPRRRKPRTPTS